MQPNHCKSRKLTMSAEPLASDVVGLTKVAPVSRLGRVQAWFKTYKVLG
jgi:hypothetical protein